MKKIKFWMSVFLLMYTLWEYVYAHLFKFG